MSEQEAVEQEFGEANADSEALPLFDAFEVATSIAGLVMDQEVPYAEDSAEEFESARHMQQAVDKIDRRTKNLASKQVDTTDREQLLRNGIGARSLLEHEEVITLTTIIQHGVAIDPELSPKTVPIDRQQRQVLRAAQDAQNIMIEANMRLVMKIAQKVPLPPSMELIDLVQEGSIGLRTAALKFDPMLGFKFSTYAYKWIRQAVDRAIDAKGSVVGLPTGHSSELRAAMRRIDSGEDEVLTDTMKAIARFQHVDSLDRNLLANGSGKATVGDRLPSTESTPDERIDDFSELVMIGQAFQQLSKRTQHYIVAYLGLETGTPQTYRELAQNSDYTAQNIQRIVKTGFRDIRYYARKHSEKGEVPDEDSIR